MKAASVRRLVQLLTTFGPCMAGVLIALVLVSLSPPHVGGAPKFSEWGTPENLGCGVNSASNDLFPTVSKNGRSLYFASNRPGGSGGVDIGVSQRSPVDDSWGTPVNLGTIINTAEGEGGPSLSRDEHWLFFNRNLLARPEQPGQPAQPAQPPDIWASWREDVHDDFGWQEPVKLEGVNSDFFEAGTSYFENEEGGVPLLFLGKALTNKPLPPSTVLLDSDIYVSELQPDGTFGEARRVAELSRDDRAEQRPSVSFDGLEIFFTQNASPSSPLNFEVMVSTRATVFDAWGTPTNLTTINSTADDGQAHIAADRRTLFFSSGRPGRTCEPEETGDCACGPRGNRRPIHEYEDKEIIGR
jgi:hypothetical protein